MKVIIDRFEGRFAVAEYTDDSGKEQFAEIARVLVPSAKEGDTVDVSIDQEDTKKRADRIKKLMDDLFE